MIGKEMQKCLRKPALVPFVHHRSYMNFPSTESGLFSEM
jgi:hypothetical protein